MGFFSSIGKIISKPIEAVTSIFNTKSQNNAAKDVASTNASVAKDTNATNLAIAQEQTKQLEKEIAFRQQQADKDREVQLQAVEANKFFAEQGLALEERAIEAAEKAAKEQAEATKAAARAQEQAAASQEVAAILGKPDLKQLAIPALIAVYLYYKFIW